MIDPTRETAYRYSATPFMNQKKYDQARERYIGRTTGCYQIDITNQDGKLVATFESSVFRMGDKLPFAQE